MHTTFTRSATFICCFLLLAGLLHTPALYATHAMGADLTYGCLGSNQYLIILKFFRDCKGITPGGSYAIQYSSAQCGVSGSITLTLVPPIPPLAANPQDITPLCPGQQSACGGNGPYGVQQWFYQGTLTLPPGCGSDWILRWSECCRNNAITSLNGPGNQNLYVEANINNTLPTCNTSPQFLNPPVPFTCVNQPVFYNHGVVDADGDQLVFSLVNCEQAPNTTVTYAGGFNGPNPLSTASGITINPTTGDINFTPNQVQVAVICVLVEEYRNGVKIGEVVRDMQVTVVNCNNAAPTASGMNGAGGVYSTSICANQPLCFDIIGNDSNASNQITTTWNGGISGATFTPGPVSNPTTSTFCWTPTDADIGTHFFTVTMQDNACPIVATGIYSYTINVTPNPNPPVNAGADVGICAGGSAPLNASIIGPLPPGVSVVSYTWSPATGLNTTNGASVIASPTATTTYQVTAVYSDFCQSTDQVTVTVNPSPSVNLYPNSNIVVCGGGSITINSLTSPDVISYQWSPAAGLSSATVANPTITPTASGAYSVTVTNAFGCTAQASVNIGVSLPPPDVCTNLYVTPTGSGTGLSPSSPTNLLNAITQAACNNATIKMAIGTYNFDNPINIYSNMTIEGGFDPANNWVKTSQPGATTIHRTALNTEGGVNERRIVALYGVQISYFRLQDLTITTANAPTTSGSGASTYVLHCDGCSDFQIVRTQLLPGNASNGTNGVSPPGVGGGSAGGNGGNGGAQGSGCNNAGAAGTTGQTVAGGGGAGGSGGAGGNGTGCTLGCGSSGNNGNNGSNGQPGPAGANAPAAAPPAPAMNYPFFVPATQSASGGNGTGGGGGGGGGGAATGTCCSGSFSGNAAGGAGGGGGFGGAGGTGGFGGGGSFGAYLVNNGGGSFIDCNIALTPVANGGLPGNGQQGTLGTAGSAGTSRTCTPIIGGSTTRTGGNGGAGGAGGAGGNGQPGAPGVSSRIAVQGALPQVQVNGAPQAMAAGFNSPIVFNLAAQPVITVSNVSCTYTNVTYTGGPFTNLGAGATNPPGAVTQYTGTGRKTPVLGPHQYVGFHNIAIDGSAPPGILTTANPTGIPDQYFVCQGDAASFTSTVTYGLTYHWNFGGAVAPNTYDGPNFQSVSGLTFNTPGTFTITHYIVTDCCGPSPSKQITLIVDPLPVITSVTASPQNTCQGGAVTLSVTGTAATFEWSPASSVTPATGTTVTANPTATTTYQVTALSASGNCVVTQNITVTVLPPPTVSLTATNAVCTPNGAVNSSVSGGSGNFSYAWDTNNDNIPDAFTPNLSNLAVGSYTVTVTDNVSGCQVTQSVNVNPGAGSLSAFVQNNTTAGCSGAADGTATIGVVGGAPPYSYAWSPNVSNTASAAGLAAGNYTVTVSAAGCTSVVSFSIFGPAPVQLQLLEVTPNTCSTANNGSFLVDATGGNSSAYTFAVSGPNGFTAAGNNQTGLQSGNYTVTVTDANNCTATLNVNVPATGADDVATLSYPGVNFCQGQALTLAPNITGVQGGTFTAAPAGLTMSASGIINVDASSSGSYTITYNTAGAPTSVCPITVTYSLTLHPSPVLPPLQTDACEGETIDLSSLTPALPNVTFTWFAGTPATGTNLGATPTITATATGGITYWLQATDATTGCADEEPLTINITTPTFTTNPPPTPCTGETLDLTTLNGTGNGAFEWYDAQPASGNLITAPVTITANTSFWVLFTQNGSGCQNEAEVTITLAPQPVFTINPPPLPCPGESIVLSTLNGTGNGAFEWYDAQAPAGNPLTDITLTADVTLWVQFTDAATGCTAGQQVPFTYTPELVVSTLPPPVVCAGETIDVNLLNGSQNGTYLWYDAPNAGNLITSPISVTAATSVWVVFTDALTGCQATAEVVLTPAPAPALSYIQPSPLCIGQSLNLTTLNGIEPGIYEWYDAEPSSGNLITDPISFSTSNIVWLLFTDAATGCQDSAFVFIPVSPQPVFTLNAPTAVCAGEPVTLSTLQGAGNGLFTWFEGNPTLGQLAPAQVTPAPGNEYWAVFTDNTTGCTDAASVSIPVLPLPTATLSGNAAICPGSSANITVTLTGTPNWTITYTNGAATFTHTATASPAAISVTPTANTTYSLTGVTDGNGCVATNLSGSATVSLLDSPVYNNLSTQCNATNDGFTVSFNLSGGNAATYNVTGSVSGSITQSGGVYTFTSNTIPSGSGYNFTLTDANNCAPVVINGNPVLCNCTTDAGTMTNTTPNTLCDTGQTFTALHNGNQTLEPDDIAVYVLHTNSGGVLGTIIASNPASGSFAFAPPMQYGVTYYISLVAANNNGAGFIDVTDPCLSVAPGTPVVFFPIPTATLSGNATICAGDATNLTFTLTGTPPYNLTYTDNAGNTYTEIANTSQHTVQVSPAADITYTLTALTDAHCTGAVQGSAAITVVAQPQPAITGNNPICTGETITLDAGAGYAAYLWQDGSTGQTLTVTASGVYLVTVSLASGCEGYANAAVTVNTPPAPVILGNVGFCPGSSGITLDAGAGYAAYTWQDGSTAQTLAVTASGNYSVTVTDGNNCTGSATVNAAPFTTTPPTISGNLGICSYETTTLTASSGYTAYLWDTGETTESITTNAAGAHSVTVTDGNGCTASASLSVTVNAAPTVNIGGSTTFCTGDNTTLNATAGFTSYLWTGGATTQSTTVNAAGTYGVTVTNAAGCTGSASVSVTESTSLNPVILETPACQNTVLDAGAGFGSYSWAPGGETTSGITVTQSGTYSVTVSNSATCTGEAAITITVAQPATANAGQDAVVCGYVYPLAASGISGSWSYNGAGNVVFTNPNTPNTLVTVDDCGVYDFIWTENNGLCQTPDTVQVGFVDAPEVIGACPPEEENVCGNSVGITPASVVGSLCSVSDCPAGGTEWNNILAALGIDCAPIAGTCHWEWEFLDGPQSAASVSFVPDEFTPDVTVTVTPFGRYRFRWVCDLPANCPLQGCGATFADKIYHFIEPLQAFEVAVCDPTPGSYTVTINLIGGLPPYIVNGNPVFGNVYTETLPVGAPYNFFIESGSPVCPPAVVSGISPDCTCPPPPLTIGGNLQICPGETTTLSATPGYAQYLWMPGAMNTPDMLVFAGGMYSVTITDVAGCTASASVVVVESVPITVNAGLDDSTCDLFYALNATPATGGTWSSPNAGVTFSNPNSATATATVPNFGSYTFTYTVTDINGCTNADDVAITFTDTPVVNAGPDAQTCGLTYALSATPLNNGAWSSPDAGVTFSNPNSATATATVPTYGSYTFVWTVTGASGNCDGNDAVQVSFAEQLAVSNQNTECFGLTYTVSFTLSGGNAAGYAFTGTSGTFDATTGVFTSLPIASGSPYNITITDGSVCEPVVVQGSFDCACVTFAGTMPLTPITLCGGGEITITNNGDEFFDDFDALTYVLHTGSSTALGTVLAQNENGTFTIAPPLLQAGVTYYVSAVAGNPDGAGGVDFTDICLSVAAGTPVSFTNPPTLNALPDQTICAGETFDLSALQQADLSGSFNWYSQNPALGGSPITATVSPTANATYWVIYNEGLCADTAAVNIAVSAVTITDITPNQTIAEGQSVSLTATATSTGGDAVTLTWQGLTGSNPTVQPTQTTTYTVTATNAAGCTATAQATITVIRQNALLIPNAFSPNADGVNDVFRVWGANIAEIEMYVYDRWGKRMFETKTTDILQGWDGTNNGVDAELGVYVFYVNATFTDGKQEFLKGNVTLVR
ncbi:MAG TPA: gliding motility-associated C-terminal domain-containing protein [Chitinophagales bacterium]|nr:gliding motility-associated C-terminal domain-containing protein [Chitinophagales bacterium]HRK26884.1 gliding motility-associated C-terminal domain-containing protein [Chitinophagales bacterium]